MRVVVILLLLSSPAVAGEWAFELGSDVVHAKGLRAWSLSIDNDNSRFRYGSMGQEGVEVKFFSAEYVWRPTQNFSPHLGIVHIDHKTKLNGTLWNFSLGFRYQITKKVFFGLVHYSHAKGLGIAPEKSNLGINLLTIGTRF